MISTIRRAARHPLCLARRYAGVFSQNHQTSVSADAGATRLSALRGISDSGRARGVPERHGAGTAPGPSVSPMWGPYRPHCAAEPIPPGQRGIPSAEPGPSPEEDSAPLLHLGRGEACAQSRVGLRLDPVRRTATLRGCPRTPVTAWLKAPSPGAFHLLIDAPAWSIAPSPSPMSRNRSRGSALPDSTSFPHHLQRRLLDFHR